MAIHFHCSFPLSPLSGVSVAPLYPQLCSPLIYTSLKSVVYRVTFQKKVLAISTFLFSIFLVDVCILYRSLAHPVRPQRAPFDRAESYLFLLSTAAVNALCPDRFHRCHASHALASLLNISLVTSISSPSSYVDDALYSAVMIYPLVFTMFLGADLRLSITSFTT